MKQVPTINISMSAPDNQHKNNTRLKLKHGVGVEMRAIWNPIITVREDDDLAALLDMKQPYTVVKDT